jgi:hypothetical protein
MQPVNSQQSQQVSLTDLSPDLDVNARMNDENLDPRIS